MKSQLLIVALLTVFVVSTAISKDTPGHGGDAKHVAVLPHNIKWGPGAPGLPPGVQMAVLVGDPSKSGMPYVIRAKMPDGYKVPPHWHPTDENITVLKGTLLMGAGERLDPAKTEELPAGAFMRMPKNARHFAIAKGETIIQLHGSGPFEIIYVNPTDDPRQKAEKK